MLECITYIVRSSAAAAAGAAAIVALAAVVLWFLLLLGAYPWYPSSVSSYTFSSSLCSYVKFI